MSSATQETLRQRRATTAASEPGPAPTSDLVNYADKAHNTDTSDSATVHNHSHSNPCPSCFSIRSCGWCMKVYCQAFVAIAAMGIAFLVFRAYTIPVRQQFALMNEHSVSTAPDGSFNRNRMMEINFAHNDSFYQWWNFLVFDAKTRDHFNIMYAISVPRDDELVQLAGASTVLSPQQKMQRARVRVSIAHLRGSKNIAAAKSHVYCAKNSWDTSDPHAMSEACAASNAQTVELHRHRNAHVKFSNRYDMHVYLDGSERHALVEQDDGSYCIRGSMEAAEMIGDADTNTISWDMCMKRQHGHYNGVKKDATKSCAIASNLFGYNSVVQGYVESAGERYDIDSSARFRAYAAGSWGCMLPTGDPAIDHPWTWLWLVIPGETPADDISFCAGTARFEMPAVGPISGGYGVANVPASLGVADGHFSIQHATLWHNTSLQLTVEASSSDEYFSLLKVTQHDWSVFTDQFGDADVPLRQTFTFVSKNYRVVLDFFPTLDQYFRAPLVHNDRIFSDFRAVGVKTHVTIEQLAPLDGATKQVLLDKWVNTMNAVEYAYETPVLAGHKDVGLL
jgi:hypothetical protein